MKYEIYWLSEDKTLYSNYAKNKRELKSKVNYFVNEKGLKLNDNDRFNNLQVSKRLRNGHWLILSAQEMLNEMKVKEV